MARLLQDLAPTDVDRPPQDVAAQLGEWLGPMDCIQLDGGLQAIATFAARARAPGQPVDTAQLLAHCAQVEATLQRQIDATVAASRAEAIQGDAEPRRYDPHHKRHQDLQKQMAEQLAQCRAHVRQALSTSSPRLRQLVALDALMEQALGEREQKLLGALPVLMSRRFDAATVADQGFARDLQAMLSAEFQARWAPIQGLIEAAQVTAPEQDR